MEVKIGEAQAKVVIKIEKGTEPRILFRSNWKNIKKSTEAAFNLEEDLNLAEKLRFTVIKVSEAPKKEG